MTFLGHFCGIVMSLVRKKIWYFQISDIGSIPLCISFSSLSLHQKGVRFCVQKYKFIYSLNCQQLAGSNDVRTLKDLTLLVVQLECEGCSGKLSVLDSMNYIISLTTLNKNASLSEALIEIQSVRTDEQQRVVFFRTKHFHQCTRWKVWLPGKE